MCMCMCIYIYIQRGKPGRPHIYIYIYICIYIYIYMYMSRMYMRRLAGTLVDQSARASDALVDWVGLRGIVRGCRV